MLVGTRRRAATDDAAMRGGAISRASRRPRCSSDFPDFAFYRIDDRPACIWSRASGASSTCSADGHADRRSPMRGALLAAEAGRRRAHERRSSPTRCGSMRRSCSAPRTATWRCVGCDPDGLDLQLGAHGAAAADFPAARHARPSRRVLRQAWLEGSVGAQRMRTAARRAAARRITLRA